VGPIFLTVLGMVAEMERKFIRERQQAGIEAAKAKGVYRGRKPSVPAEKVREMQAAGQGPTAIAKALGISQMSVHRALVGGCGATPREQIHWAGLCCLFAQVEVGRVELACLSKSLFECAISMVYADSAVSAVSLEQALA
jgi:hypothetical protein